MSYLKRYSKLIDEWQNLPNESFLGRDDIRSMNYFQYQEFYRIRSVIDYNYEKLSSSYERDRLKRNTFVGVDEINRVINLIKEIPNE